MEKEKKKPAWGGKTLRKQIKEKGVSGDLHDRGEPLELDGAHPVNELGLRGFRAMVAEKFPQYHPFSS